jgi:hypothetical protein
MVIGGAAAAAAFAHQAGVWIGGADHPVVDGFIRRMAFRHSRRPFLQTTSLNSDWGNTPSKCALESRAIKHFHGLPRYFCYLAKHNLHRP